MSMQNEDTAPLTAEEEHVAREYLRHVYDVVNGVQELREVREKAYSQASTWAIELTRICKARDMLPKRLLFSLLQAARILENEALGLQTQQARVIEIADSLNHTLWLLLQGRSHEEDKRERPPFR